MVSLDFLPTVGGITAHVYELSKALIDQGHQVSLVTKKLPNAQLDEQMIDGIKVFRVRLFGPGFMYGWIINRFVKKLKTTHSFDLIHIHGMRPLEFFDKKETPLVYTNHTSGYLKRLQKGGYRIAHMKILFAKPDLFLAPSEELLHTPFEISAKKIYIPNGIDVSIYTKNDSVRESLRKQYNLNETDIVALVTRRLVQKNGVKYLAEATQYIQNSNLKLFLIGDGEERDVVEQLLNQNFKDRYIMFGAMEHKDIIPFYSIADLAILPSLMEATSISGLEAMASSLPLVGTKVGGIPDLIDDGQTGLLCEAASPISLANAIDKLLEADYLDMGRKGREKVVASFEWAHIAQETIKAYELVR